MKREQSYPSKVLLLGEYTVLLGSNALAVPFHTFHGNWCDRPMQDTMKSLMLEWVVYLREKVKAFPVEFDIDDLEKELEDGLGFCSNIPVGYGLGSSGAITAAVWDRYGRDLSDMDQLLKVLSTMESFFHGKSSGLDPLVSLSNRPVLTGRKTTYPKQECWDAFGLKKHLFLWNSGEERRTSALVKRFTEDLQDPVYHLAVTRDLIPQNDNAINALLVNDTATFDKAWRRISELQIELFRNMIPGPVRKRWETGLEKGHYFFKLCGAGGGGFFLVYAPQTFPEDVKDQKELMPL